MLIGHQMVFFWTWRYTLQSPLLAKRLLVVGQAIPVTDTGVLDTVHSLPQTVRADGNLLHPRLNALVRSQLQHLQRLASAAQVRATNEAAIGQEVLVADGDAAAARKTDGNPLAVDVKQTEIGREVEALKGVGRVEDEVERHLVRLVPALLAGGEIAVGAHLEGVGLLGAGAGDGPDLGAEGLGEHDTEVTNATNTDDADLLARAATVADERAVGGQTGAKHGRGEGAREGFGDGEDPSRY